MLFSGKRFCQSAGKQPGVLGNRVDVVSQGQGDNVGLQSIDHRAGLLAGAGMGLLNGDRLAGLRLPVFGEGLIEILIQLARGVVGNIEQRNLAALRSPRD